MRTTCIATLLGATLFVACDDHATPTTTATGSATTATEDLKQAGRDLGAAAQKAVGDAGRAASEEAKREVRNLDVKVTTTDAGLR